MLVLNTGDKLRGDAFVEGVVDYTVHGLVGETLTMIAGGQLLSAENDLYVATDTVVITSIILVNSDSVSRTINLYIKPDGESSRYIVAKDLNLGIGHSLHYDGVKVSVIGPYIGSAGLSDHSKLSNLHYDYAGHTGFASSEALSTVSGVLQSDIDGKAITFLELTDTPSSYDDDKYLRSTTSGAEWATVDAATIQASDVRFDTIGDPTYETAQDWFDIIQSAGILDGFILSNSRVATELDISAGKGIIKETDSELGATVSFETDAVEDITLIADNINYIYVDYNSGTPQIVATTNRTAVELNRMFTVGRVYKNGTALHILNAGVHLSNLARTEHERLVERDGFTYTSGSVTSETGILNLDITAGVWYLGHNRIITDTLNSNTGGDTWIYTHYGAASWITDNSTASGVDCTHYNTGTDVLGTLGPNNYSTQWVYITADNYWYIIYGNQNGNLAVAESALPPTSVPTFVETMGELISKMIVKQDGTIVDVQSVHAVVFTTTSITNHNETGGIQGGAANEYYHLTSAEHTDFIDGIIDGGAF